MLRPPSNAGGPDRCPKLYLHVRPGSGSRRRFERASRRIGGVAAALCSLLLGVASVAAQATVVVEVKDKAGKLADARVDLKDAAGKAVAGCDAVGGRCEMSGVPGGSYTVELKPKKGPAPKPTKAMIPPSGRVTLIVNTGS